MGGTNKVSKHLFYVHLYNQINIAEKIDISKERWPMISSFDKLLSKDFLIVITLSPKS